MSFIFYLISIIIFFLPSLTHQRGEEDERRQQLHSRGSLQAEIANGIENAISGLKLEVGWCSQRKTTRFFKKLDGAH